MDREEAVKIIRDAANQCRDVDIFKKYGPKVKIPVPEESNSAPDSYVAPNYVELTLHKVLVETKLVYEVWGTYKGHRVLLDTIPIKSDV